MQHLHRAGKVTRQSQRWMYTHVGFADIEITATCKSVSEIPPGPATGPPNPPELCRRGRSLRGQWLNASGSARLSWHACGARARGTANSSAGTSVGDDGAG